jgi:hypothetical protein
MGSGYRTFTAGEVLTASNVQNYLQDQAVMVFAGTAARSSAIGTANFEEGMLTYLTDVDKLQVYTGATFADVYPAAASTQGLTLINTTSFSGVTSVSLPASTFTTTYDRYLIKGNLSCSNATVDINGRLRTAGTDNSGTIYNYQYLSSSGVGVGAGRATSQNLISGMGGYYPTAGRDNSDINIEIRKPAQTDYTLGYYQYPTVTEGNIGQILYLFGTTGTTSFDSLSLIASAGTITGTIYCYAYND